MTDGSGRRQVIITGAAGGMGRACARMFGTTHDLILTDVAAEPLTAFADALRHEGFAVPCAHAGDLGSDAILSALAGQLTESAPFSLIHTAGLSPSLASWDRIMQVNLVATEKLLRTIEPRLVPGSAAVLIASSAAHMMPRNPEADGVMQDPLAPDFMTRIEALIRRAFEAAPVMGLGGISYTYSKQAVLDIVRRRSVAWGRRGRITSISPGMILTPMGRKELAETAGAAEVSRATPAGRDGTALDIAQAAYFLAGEHASYVSGCDLQVDGGAVACVSLGMG